MVYLYILKNKLNRYYVGITKLHPNKRLKRHNQGAVYSTKLGRPWKIIYIEQYINYEEARKREKQIKSWKGGDAFKNFISRVARSSNGRTQRSGRWNLGSNPSLAALGMRDEER